MSGEERLGLLFDTCEDVAQMTRFHLNRFEATLSAAAEEHADGGDELLTILATLGDLWDEYRFAHETLADAVNDVYREALR